MAIVDNVSQRVLHRRSNAWIFIDGGNVRIVKERLGAQFQQVGNTRPPVRSTWLCCDPTSFYCALASAISRGAGGNLGVVRLLCSSGCPSHVDACALAVASRKCPSEGLPKKMMLRTRRQVSAVVA